METSSTLIFQIWDFVPEEKSLSLGALCERFTEKASLQSENVGLKLWLHKDYPNVLTSTPWWTLAALCVAVLTRPGYSSCEAIEDLRKHAWHMAVRAHNSQGKWMIVREVLSYDFYTRGEVGFWSILLPYMSSNDLFGNFLKKVYCILEHEMLTFQPLQKSYKEYSSRRDRLRGVRRKIRRRGYNDKGSLLPSHRRLPDPSGDFTLMEQEFRRLEEEAKLPQFKEPPPRYWYKSQFPGSDRQARHSKKMKGGDSHGTTGKT